jgi:integrase
VAVFHALRHSFITRAWELGATADVVMSLARHRSLQMTLRYTHPDRSAQVRAIQAIPSPLDEKEEL